MLKERRKPVLVIQHAPHEHASMVGRALTAQGIQTQTIRLFENEKLPKIDQIQGILSLGGPMCSNDEKNYDWIKAELSLLEDALLSQTLVVGICLGGQLLARAAGGQVQKNDSMEVGWHPVNPAADGLKDPILADLFERNQNHDSQSHLYQWHEDTFDIPKGAKLLATSKLCPRQAFQIGEKAYGFQFHPEADEQLVREWTSYPGVEDEILAHRKKFGTQAVQDKNQQISQSKKFELCSLIVTLGIANHFRNRKSESQEKTPDFVVGSQQRISLEGPDRRHFILQGSLEYSLNLSHGKYVVLKDNSGLSWPVRFSDLQSYRP